MEINKQLTSFFMMMLLGLTLGILFDFYRVMRQVFHMRSMLTFLFDGLYWLIALILTFACLLLSNWAELRFYVFIGMLSGTLFYYQFMSRAVLLVFFRIMRVILAVFAWGRTVIGSCILRPVGYMLGIFLFPLRLAIRKCGAISHKCRNFRIIRKKTKKAGDPGSKV